MHIHFVLGISASMFKNTDNEEIAIGQVLEIINEYNIDQTNLLEILQLLAIHDITVEFTDIVHVPA